jgi:hypothetical protein
VARRPRRPTTRGPSSCRAPGPPGRGAGVGCPGAVGCSRGSGELPAGPQRTPLPARRSARGRTAVVRLRRVSPESPGLTRRRRGRGWSYLDASEPGWRPRGGGPDRGAGDPSGVDRRLDLPAPNGSSAGRRHRRPRPSPVPLPPGLAASAGTGRSTTGCSRSPAGSPLRARRSRRPSSPGRVGPPDPRAGAGLCVPAARPGVLQDRRGGLRPVQRHLRSGDAAPRARHGAPRRPGHLRVRRQVRASTGTSP